MINKRHEKNSFPNIQHFKKLFSVMKTSSTLNFLFKISLFYIIFLVISLCYIILKGFIKKKFVVKFEKRFKLILIFYLSYTINAFFLTFRFLNVQVFATSV